MGGDSVSGHEKMPQTFSISAALARKQKWTVSCRHRPFSVLLFPCLRPHAGGDPYRPPGSTHPSYFDPRPPVRGGDLVEAGLLYPSSDFNPRPPCWGRHDGWSLPGLTVQISIHAPRAGGDPARPVWSCRRRYFNPRPPCGGRQQIHKALGIKNLFQSTPPVRGATILSVSETVSLRFQSTPPVRGATLATLRQKTFSIRISIHAPRAGGDGNSPGTSTSCRTFQSTPPVRGATAIPATAARPCGFQSTPPVRGATVYKC